MSVWMEKYNNRAIVGVEVLALNSRWQKWALAGKKEAIIRAGDEVWRISPKYFLFFVQMGSTRKC